MNQQVKENSTELPTPAMNGEKNNTPADWTAPSYSKSGQVRIDYRLAEKNHCLIEEKACPELENIKMLRTRLLSRTREKGWRTIMVTSANPGEGKTVTAINLAFAMAREYQQTVALVDGDLRNPAITKYLGINAQRGLVDYFVNSTPLQEIILWPGVEKLTIIPAGKPVVNSTEIIGSPSMKALVAEMKARYHDRYVFFDFPPLLTVADAIAFIPQVDCVLLVVEAGRTPVQDINRALNLIPSEKLLGLVLNKEEREQVSY